MPKPGQTTASGRRRTRRSVTMRMMRRQEKKSHLKVGRLMLNSKYVRTKMAPVRNSMMGYIGEMGRAQVRHLPRSQSHPRIGTLSYGLIGVLQRGQREAGETMDSPSGMREIHTFRKLPMTMPKRKKKNGIIGLTLTQEEMVLNARNGVGCRMVNREERTKGWEDSSRRGRGKRTPRHKG